jgi:hypothetical protein
MFILPTINIIDASASALARASASASSSAWAWANARANASASARVSARAGARASALARPSARASASASASSRASSRARAGALAWVRAWARADLFFVPACVFDISAIRAGDTTAAGAYCDLFQEEYCPVNQGDPVYIRTPLDLFAGLVDSVDGMFLKLSPGCVGIKLSNNETNLIETGMPTSDDEYYPCPKGHMVPILAIVGITPLPKFNPKDWPKQS